MPSGNEVGSSSLLDPIAHHLGNRGDGPGCLATCTPPTSRCPSIILVAPGEDVSSARQPIRSHTPILDQMPCPNYQEERPNTWADAHLRSPFFTAVHPASHILHHDPITSSQNDSTSTASFHLSRRTTQAFTQSIQSDAAHTVGAPARSSQLWHQHPSNTRSHHNMIHDEVEHKSPSRPLPEVDDLLLQRLSPVPHALMDTASEEDGDDSMDDALLLPESVVANCGGEEASCGGAACRTDVCTPVENLIPSVGQSPHLSCAPGPSRTYTPRLFLSSRPTTPRKRRRRASTAESMQGTRRSASRGSRRGAGVMEGVEYVAPNRNPFSHYRGSPGWMVLGEVPVMDRDFSPDTATFRSLRPEAAVVHYEQTLPPPATAPTANLPRGATAIWQDDLIHDTSGHSTLSEADPLRPPMPRGKPPTPQLSAGSLTPVRGAATSPGWGHSPVSGTGAGLSIFPLLPPATSHLSRSNNSPTLAATTTASWTATHRGTARSDREAGSTQRPSSSVGSPILLGMPSSESIAPQPNPTRYNSLPCSPPLRPAPTYQPTKQPLPLPDSPGLLRAREPLAWHWPRSLDQSLEGLIDWPPMLPAALAESGTPRLSDGEHDGEKVMMLDADEEEEEAGARFRRCGRFQYLHHLPGGPRLMPLNLDHNGIVWLVCNRLDGLPYALKEVRVEHMNPAEIAALSLSSNPRTMRDLWSERFIMRFHHCPAVSRDGRGIVCPAASQVRLLQTEFFPRGSVWEYALDPFGRRSAATAAVVPRVVALTGDEWRTIAIHALMGLSALHGSALIHGCPLPFNLFLSDVLCAKWANFGAAVKCPDVYPDTIPSPLLPTAASMKSASPFEMEVAIFCRGLLMLMEACEQRADGRLSTSEILHKSPWEWLPSCMLADPLDATEHCDPNTTTLISVLHRATWDPTSAETLLQRLHPPSMEELTTTWMLDLEIQRLSWELVASRPPLHASKCVEERSSDSSTLTTSGIEASLLLARPLDVSGGSQRRPQDHSGMSCSHTSIDAHVRRFAEAQLLAAFNPSTGMHWLISQVAGVLLDGDAAAATAVMASLRPPTWAAARPLCCREGLPPTHVK